MASQKTRFSINLASLDYPADSMHGGRMSDSWSDYPTIKSSDYPLPVRALVCNMYNMHYIVQYLH